MEEAEIPEAPDGAISRRDALKKGAAAGAAAAFVIPVIGTVSMSQASAQPASGTYHRDDHGDLGRHH